jgi:flagellar hook protein FlgE
MGVYSAMSTAISGLEANGQMLSVVSDNIVNSNTTGFKTSRTEFHNVLAQDILSSASGSQIGNGARVGGITNLFTQGSITRTDRSTDLAINGNGFFVVKGDAAGLTYTRDGSFRFDKDGWLTTLTGERVQAYGVSPEGKITGTMTDIRIPYAAIPAKPTGRLEVHVNLDARTEPGAPLDLTRPDETSHFTTTTQVFDSVGNAHPINVYFNKTANGTWEWHAMGDGAEFAGGEKGKPMEMAHGTLSFDQLGKLQHQEQEIVDTTFANGAVPDQKLKFDFGDAIDDLGTGQRGTTQYGSKNSLFRNVQDGWSAGTLADTIIDTEGTVTGVYSNGQNRLLGQLGLARFEATEKLIKVGANQFKETTESGQALIGKAKTSGRGALMTKSLEQSNTDLAKEFVDMIKAQRGFQASAKSITSANERLEEVINLKRT